jgi:demethylmenaquinone methyltransferase/2-methoxy-6-polyprenyl-1,4-benzoquinol methylase
VSNGKVFAPIAGRYDRINSILSLGRDQSWRRRVVDLLPGGRLLDLGAGTGAAAPVFGDREVVALDPSLEMLARNSASQRVGGVGERMPFRDGCFDAVFSAYVFRNLDSVEATLAEIARVLRPGGKAGVVGLGRPRAKWQAAIHRAGTAALLPTIGLLSGSPSAYVYLHRSLDKLPPPEEMFDGGPLAVEDVWRMGMMGFVYGAVLVKP